MGPGAHIAALIGLAAVAAALVHIPRPLLSEARGAPPAFRAQAVLSALLLLIGAAVFEVWPSLTPPAAFVAAVVLMTLAAVVAVDIGYLLIPDLFSIILAAAAFMGPMARPWPDAVGGGLICGGVLALVAWAWKRRTAVDGLGFGDIKLAAAIGALLGAEAGIWAITGSAAIGAVIGLVMQARAADRSAPQLFPYGAPMAAVAAVLFVWTRLA